VSVDKRALRESQSFYLSQTTYSSPLQLRVYNVNDILQVKIRDVNEIFGSFKLAELPLSCKAQEDIILFLQAGTKQLKLRVNFERDSSLYAELRRKE